MGSVNALKVVHIIVGLNIGGAERMLQRLVTRHGVAHGAFHVVVSLTSLGPVGRELAATGIRVESLEMKSLRDVPGALIKLHRLLRHLQPDVVQTWMYHADLMGGAVARLAGVRALLWGVRSTEIVHGSTGTAGYIRHVCAWASSWMPWRIICAAEASRQRHVGIGYCAGRMEVIPNGFDVMRFAPLTAPDVAAFRQAEGLGPDEILIGFVGRYNTAKDVPNFLRAAQQVAAAMLPARFVMVGTGMSWDNVALAGLIRELELEDRVLLLGPRSDVNLCLGAMDVFCLSSRTEGFPNVVGEAMAAGVPCVVTDVGDAALIVGDAGLVVPKEDSGQLATALLKVAGLPPQARRDIGLRARERIVRQFSMDEAIRRFDEVYRQAVQAADRKRKSG